MSLGWTKEETVEALLKKAGVRGPMTQALKDSIKLIRYRSEKVEMDFEVSYISYSLFAHRNDQFFLINPISKFRSLSGKCSTCLL